jgi:hypothetical protein
MGNIKSIGISLKRQIIFVLCSIKNNKVCEMFQLNYQKRKNKELFESLGSKENLDLLSIQNYIPIYTRFFELNDTNYNSINLNHQWYLHSIEDKIMSDSDSESSDYEDMEEGEEEDEGDEDVEVEQEQEEECSLLSITDQFYNCTLKNIQNNKQKVKPVFFKLAPIIDPYKYMVGKYDTNNQSYFTLPQINSTEKEVYSKFLDPNNCSYVDGFFLFLTSQLKYHHNFIHSVDYYGSFLAIKNEFTINVIDDIEYLADSDFFNANKNVLFKVEDYSHLVENNKQVKKPLIIDYQSNEVEGGLADLDMEDIGNLDETNQTTTFDGDCEFVGLEAVDITKHNSELFSSTASSATATTLKSASSCSSRTSYTDDESGEGECEISGDILEEEMPTEESQENSKEEEQTSSCEDMESDVSDDDDNIVLVKIPMFPVQVISMECCDDTLDNLINNTQLTEQEWLSALLQVTMILITYQKLFDFTHNDLHTNNVMYVSTEQKFIYYKCGSNFYKVPTFGRIFKIIDFGRGVFKYKGKLFFSDSFKKGEDASTQYNTEPYFNESKPRVEPNYSFDLCRLACSMLDYVINDIKECQNLSLLESYKRIIVEWCLDDKGLNVLYKNNGEDRYPDFKLYKMIARSVHNHIPLKQLSRPEFVSFRTSLNKIPKEDIDKIVNIDDMPCYSSAK